MSKITYHPLPSEISGSTPVFKVCFLRIADAPFMCFYSYFHNYLLVTWYWKMFTKAGKLGWASIIPIYNIIVLFDIIKKPMWWIAMFFIPIVNIIFVYKFSVALANKFGKGAGFGIGANLVGFPKM